MKSKIKFGELRELLVSMGFQEVADSHQTVFRHEDSDTLFVFRPYRSGDPVQRYNLIEVQEMLDARGLMTAETFASQFKKTPA